MFPESAHVGALGLEKATATIASVLRSGAEIITHFAATEEEALLVLPNLDD